MKEVFHDELVIHGSYGPLKFYGGPHLKPIETLFNKIL